MNNTTRKYYIDNLRWMILLVLIPYHTAMAWNSWSEPNYIFFEGNRLISSIVVFFSPYFMPLLFLLAGISTKYALQKRTNKEYIIERVKRLLVPLFFGMLLIMPIMTHIAMNYNKSCYWGLLSHYSVFFTKFTDLTGADGGFSFGHFWFILYLLVISIVSLGIITIFKKLNFKSKKTLTFPVVLFLGLPLPLFSDLLSIGGKSLIEYLYLFLLGYYIFSDEKIIEKAEKGRWILLAVGLAATILNVYIFLWSDSASALLNDIAKFVAEWFMILALLGLAKRYLNFSGKVSNYMSKRSFVFYILHFLFVLVFQYILYFEYGNNTAILFFGTLILSYLMTFGCCEVCLKVPFLAFLTGIKYEKEMR